MTTTKDGFVRFHRALIPHLSSQIATIKHQWLFHMTEVVNALDDNCNGRIDEGTVVYDDDGDGYCETPPCVNTTRQESDCDDDQFTVSPAGTEGDVNNDQDGNTNQQNAQGCTNFYVDSDGEDMVVVLSNVGVNRPILILQTILDDCYDSNAMHLRALSYHRFHAVVTIPLDYNRDGVEEQQYTNTYAGCTNWVALDFLPGLILMDGIVGFPAVDKLVSTFRIVIPVDYVYLAAFVVVSDT